MNTVIHKTTVRDLGRYIPMPDGNESHFMYREFIRSATAVRLGLSNIPTAEHWRCIEQLVVHVLEPVRLHFGPIRITSGYRSADLCAAVPGSSRTSNHALGQAADIEPLVAGTSLFSMLEWIHKNCDHRELIAEYFPDGWVHVAYRADGNDKTLKLKDTKHNYARVTLEQVESALRG